MNRVRGNISFTTSPLKSMPGTLFSKQSAIIHTQDRGLRLVMHDERKTFKFEIKHLSCELVKSKTKGNLIRCAWRIKTMWSEIILMSSICTEDIWFPLNWMAAVLFLKIVWFSKLVTRFKSNNSEPTKKFRNLRLEPSPYKPRFSRWRNTILQPEWVVFSTGTWFSLFWSFSPWRR